MEQNKVRTYLLYAFGEILLVVVGILIALQVNNWNEERKKKELEQNYLALLKEDLKNNADLIQLFYLDRYDRKIRALDKVRAHYQGTYNIEDSVKFALEVGYGAVFSVQAMQANSAVFEEIVSTGNLTVISDEDLRLQLIEYHSLMESYLIGMSGFQSGYLLSINSLRPFRGETPNAIDPFDMRLVIKKAKTEDFYMLANAEISFADQAIMLMSEIKDRAEEIIIRIDEIQGAN
jgi:hypothetical protein